MLLSELITLAQKHHFLIVNDNPYSIILNDRPSSLLELPGASEVCLELNSLSKSHHMPGWRLGWLAGKKRYITEVLKVKSNIDSGMFKALQLAAVKALQTPMDWHREQNEQYGSRKRLMVKLLESIGCSIEGSDHGMFLWAKIPENGMGSEAFADELLYSSNVFIPPGTVFGSHGEGYIRASLCLSEQIIAQAIERVKMVNHEG
jgi:aspartate/methionine/tyrosine aminotransferase